MTIDEAIQHCEEVAEKNEWFEKNYLENKGCKECAKEHRQLAEWLKELKAYKEQGGDAISRKYILDLIATKGANLDDDLLIVEQWIQDAPSVNPHPIECGDAISRQAVMDCFKKWQPYMATRLWDFEQELSALPSVKPQHRIWRWIEYVEPDDAEPLTLWRCDNCDTVERRKTLYCPMCGAKMEVEE